MATSHVLVIEDRGEHKGDQERSHEGSHDPQRPTGDGGDAHTKEVVAGSASTDEPKHRGEPHKDAEGGKTVVIEKHHRQSHGERPVNEQTTRPTQVTGGRARPFRGQSVAFSRPVISVHRSV